MANPEKRHEEIRDPKVPGRPDEKRAPARGETERGRQGENPGTAPEKPGNVPTQQQNKTSSGGKARGE